MNKYNVKAIRKELDDCVRNNSWKKFRSKLADLKSNPELFEAVILAKSMLTSGSLLHVLVKRSNFPLDLVFEIVNNVPSVLQMVDSNQETPLHIALERQISPEVLERFLELSSTCLAMADRYGYTPLLRAAKEDYDILYIKILLQHDKNHSTALIESKRRKGRTPLWYVASNDLQVPHSGYNEISENLRLLLVETFFALQRRNGITVDEEEWDSYMLELAEVGRRKRSECFYHDPKQLSLLMRAFASCIDLLGKYAIKMLDFFLARERYKAFISDHINPEGRYLLHHLCLAQTEDAATDNIMLEQLLRHPNIVAVVRHKDFEGNLPLHLAILSGKISFVTQLLRAYPDAVHQANKAGQLPLHLSFTSPDVSLPYTLWKAYPTAMEIQDGTTHLYPFQAAALKAASRNGNMKGEVEAEDGITWLTFQYMLLLAAPHVLGSSL